jgi:hypothetical protein
LNGNGIAFATLLRTAGQAIDPSLFFHVGADWELSAERGQQRHVAAPANSDSSASFATGKTIVSAWGPSFQ